MGKHNSDASFFYLTVKTTVRCIALPLQSQIIREYLVPCDAIACDVQGVWRRRVHIRAAQCAVFLRVAGNRVHVLLFVLSALRVHRQAEPEASAAVPAREIKKKRRVFHTSE